MLNVGAWFSKYGLLKGEDRAVVAGKDGCYVMSVDEVWGDFVALEKYE